jgi:hypothetical protein
MNDKSLYSAAVPPGGGDPVNQFDDIRAAALRHRSDGIGAIATALTS